jgi:NAD(P)-dependent dehydrogenase (short-subunit alcohol dehydrogenase family)
MLNYNAPENLLKNRIIMITGSSDGIGRTAAKTFAAHGATVILHGRNLEKLEQVYDEIMAEGGAEPVIFQLDLKTATYDDFMALKNNIEETFGKLDGLLHNASTLGRLSPISSTITNDWQNVMQVNVNAAFMLTKALLPLLEQSADASIIFTSSSVGRKGRANWGAYAASKFATEGLMQVLADELENTSKIRVNSLNPGATNTNMRRMAYPAEVPGKNPLPADIMPAYLFLMGPDSQPITGQAFDAQALKPQQ